MVASDSVDDLNDFRIKIFRIDAVASTLPPIIGLTIFGYPVEDNPGVLITTGGLLTLVVVAYLLARKGTFEYAKWIRVLGVLLGVIVASYYFPFYQHEYLFLPVIVLSLFLSYPFANVKHSYVSGVALVIAMFALILIEDQAVMDPRYNLFNKVHLVAVTYSFFVGILMTALIQHKSNLLLRKDQVVIERKNAQLEKYIASNVQLEQFAHIASHDLRSPLRTVSSFAGLLQQKSTGKLTDRENEYVHYIQEGVQSMSRLIDDLLMYSKVNSQQLQSEEIQIDALIKEILFSLSFSIEQSGAMIDYESGVEVITGDPVKLKQVLQNLVSNALKFVDKQKPLIEIRIAQTGDDVFFCVADNGIGVPEEFYDDIFEPYRQLHSKDKFEGSGMGLAICKKIIDQHGGRIWIEPHTDKSGSRFCFTIPSKALANVF